MTVWPKMRLSEVAEVGSGAGFPLKYQGKDQGDYPFFKVSDMNTAGNEKVMGAANNYISKEIRQALRAKSFPPGSSIFPKIGAAIATNKKRLLAVASCVDNNVMAIVPDVRHLEPEYLYFLLANKDLADFASKANPPSIRKTVVEDWVVPLPPFDEQRRIVDILNRANGILRLRRQAQEKARQLIPALFVKMFGDPAINPRRWSLMRFGDVLARPLRNGVSPSRRGQHRAHVLTLSAITRSAFDPSAIKDGLFDEPPRESHCVCLEDFLICRGNGNVSLVGRGQFPSCRMNGVAFPDTMIAARPNSAYLLPEYLTAIWNTDLLRPQIQTAAKTTNGTYKINQTAIENFRLLLPPLDLQIDFAARVADIHFIVEQQNRMAAGSERLVDSLMHWMFEEGPRYARHFDSVPANSDG